MKAVSLLATLLLAACATAQAPLHGTPVPQPHPAPNFTLRDQNGRPFVLRAQRGRTVLLYFGYTHCTDVCPQTLRVLARARTDAGAAAASDEIVMVSVDPAHDTPRAYRRFFRRIGVRAVGLNGSPATLARIERAYGVATQPGTAAGHTDFTYVIDSRGNLREILDPQSSVRSISADLRTLSA